MPDELTPRHCLRLNAPPALRPAFVSIQARHVILPGQNRPPSGRKAKSHLRNKKSERAPDNSLPACQSAAAFSALAASCDLQFGLQACGALACGC